MPSLKCRLSLPQKHLTNAHINRFTIYLEFLIITTATFKFWSVSYSSKGWTLQQKDMKHDTHTRTPANWEWEQQPKKGRLKEREVVISANCNDNISCCDYAIFQISLRVWHCQGDGFSFSAPFVILSFNCWYQFNPKYALKIYEFISQNVSITDFGSNGTNTTIHQPDERE